MPPHPLAEQLASLLSSTSRTWRGKMDERLKPLGLSQAKWLVLYALSVGSEGGSQKDLAERIGIEGPTLVGLLDRLAADGWIERRESTADRRIKTVHLLPKADQALSQIHAVAVALRHELLADVSAKDLEICMTTLEKIKHKLETLP